MTVRLNWLLCRAITQASEAGKHAVFSLVRQIWEGCGWERMLWLVMQISEPGGMIEVGRICWWGIYDDFVPIWAFLELWLTPLGYDLSCCEVVDYFYVRPLMRVSVQSSQSESLSCYPVPWQITEFHFLSFLSSLLPLSTDGSSWKHEGGMMLNEWRCRDFSIRDDVLFG